MYFALPSQPGKALYTSVRELVENGLDAAESIGEFPLLEIRMCVVLGGLSFPSFPAESGSTLRRRSGASSVSADPAERNKSSGRLAGPLVCELTCLFFPLLQR